MRVIIRIFAVIAFMSIAQGCSICKQTIIPKIKGQVFDANDHNPIADALVCLQINKLQQPVITVHSDKTGKFYIKEKASLHFHSHMPLAYLSSNAPCEWVPNGTITVSCDGYIDYMRRKSFPYSKNIVAIQLQPDGR